MPTLQHENPLAETGWNSRVCGQPDSGVFHSAEWAAVLEQTYGFTPVYFTATDNGRLLSMLPVMEVDTLRGGRHGVSIPFTDQCEPLGSGDRSLQSLFKAALQFGRDRDWKYVEWRGGPATETLFAGLPPSVTFYGHRLELTADTAALFSRFKPAVRRAVRKAERSGVTVEMAQTPEAIQDYYQLHCETRRHHGLPPQPFTFFRHIQEHVLSHNMGTVISAKYQERTVGAAIFFHLGAEAVYKFGASDLAFQHLRINNLIMWEAIKWYAQAGKKALNLGRTSIPNQGLRRYKLGWGAQEYLLHYYRYDLRKEAYVTARDEVLGWYNPIFRALPVFLSRAIGSVVYKHVA